MSASNLRLTLCCLLLALSAPAQNHAQNHAPRSLADRPPMGWNSWDAYGLSITEPQFRDNVNVLAHTLKPFGWNYAVIDEGWFLRNPEVRSTPDKLGYELDENGRYIPVPARFPSAIQGARNTGFQALGQFVHQQGLKFGIHIVRGIPRESVTRNLSVAGSRFHAQDVADTSDACPWDPTNWGVRDTPAGQAWYDSLLTQYAAWGVDYLKVDCISDHPFKLAEIRMIHRAILKTGRPIVLSLSPGPTSAGVIAQISPLAQMWRISDDVWDRWSNSSAFPHSLHDQFDLAAMWVPFAHPGNWPDADMLPLGFLGPVPGEGSPRQTMLTHDEQRTMLTLWSIARSPLILGANLTRLDPWTTELLTNPDVLNLDQNGHDQRQLAREGNTIVWISSGKPGTSYLAFFNLDDKQVSVRHDLQFYGLPQGQFQLKELWSHADLPTSGSVQFNIPPHGCILLQVTSTPAP